jgi:hypothetical protein
MSGGLEALLYSGPPADGPVRVWWSSETPEIDELPWELVAWQNPGYRDGRFSFVRGVPGSFQPLVPLEGPLRLALIYDPASTAPELVDALTHLPDGIETVRMTQPPLEALQQAAAEGIELVHLVADGMTSLGHDGILRLPGQWADRPESLPPRELSALLMGSRVTILGLSAPEGVREATSELGASAYRAFTFLGSSQHPLPSIVAPLALLPADQTAGFWHRFYSALAETLSVEDAMTRAQGGGPPMLAALFLRHRLGNEFARRGAGTRSIREITKGLTQRAANEQVASDLMADLSKVDTRYRDLPFSVTKSDRAGREAARQSRAVEEFTDWTRTE